MPPLHEALFLVGPTATGKSAVAQYLAEADSCDILSADSMLVYRGMDIGTAKPTRAERDRVRYWGIDLVNPGEPFSVAQYLDMAREAVTATGAAGRRLIVTGGTGLYIKALIHGLDPMPSTDPVSRRCWQALLREGGVAALQDALHTRAPAWLERLSDPANSRRLMRALELVDAGLVEPPGSWGMIRALPEIAGLTAPREVLVARIGQRVQAMYRAGLLDEVRELFMERGFPDGTTAAQAVGYGEAWNCLNGRIMAAEAREQTIIRTRQLAKRQMTWFRRQCRVRWVDIGTQPDVPTVAGQVRDAWAVTGATPLGL
jgi:tRNA dimethylallyltransferase